MTPQPTIVRGDRPIATALSLVLAAWLLGGCSGGEKPAGGPPGGMPPPRQ